jgi:glycosyltransferase involved in cell wall biosynthesis
MAASWESTMTSMAESRPIEVSLIFPVRNEAQVLDLLDQRVKTVLAGLGISYELIFVDDGSDDGTTELIAYIIRHDPLTKGIVLGRHYGKEAALAAGLAQSTGLASIIMDADLQDPPELIPELLRTWKKGADVIYMRRSPSAGQLSVFRPITQFLHSLRALIADAGTPAQSIDFMLYSRRAVEALNLIVERRRYMEPLFESLDFKIAHIDYGRQPRIAGSSSWSAHEYLGFTSDGTVHPFVALMRTLMVLGLFFFAFALLASVWLLAGAIDMAHLKDAAYRSLVSSSAIIGALLFTWGWIGKKIARTLLSAKRPSYVVRRLIRSTQT